MKNTLKFACIGETLTGLGLVVSPALVIGLVFGATVEGAGIIACRLAGLGLGGDAKGILLWPAAVAHAVISLLLARVWLGAVKTI